MLVIHRWLRAPATKSDKEKPFQSTTINQARRNPGYFLIFCDGSATIDGPGLSPHERRRRGEIVDLLRRVAGERGPDFAEFAAQGRRQSLQAPRNDVVISPVRLIVSSLPVQYASGVGRRDFASRELAISEILFAP